MHKIKRMSDELSNMIAAGEVVEKPANVVKELVENAIDAKATIITISLIDHGLTEVQVEDNGEGMSQADAEIAPIRHATSKMYDVKDLQRIKTLGFRGEALAAISSVSHVTIETKTEHDEAVQLQFEGGMIVHRQDIARNVGTTIRVRSLFYNTPARFKFLSSDYQHQKQLRQLLFQFALAYPNIAFTLIEDGVVFKQTTGSQDVKNTMHELFGSTYSKTLTKIESDIQHTHIEIFLLPPDISVSHKQSMYTFINKRYVKHYAILDGILNGYEGLLMVKRFPVCLVYVKVDPSRVDVNIHPQKIHVKIAHEQVIKYHIETMIKEHFKTTPRPIYKPLENDFKYHIESMDFQSIFEEEEPIVNHDEKLPEMVYLNMLAGTYGLFQHQEGLILLDAHAAAERIRYEHYKNVFEKDFNMTTERLIPYPLTFDDTTMKDILGLNTLFQTYGFEITSEGITKHPQAVRENDLELAVEHILEAYHQQRKIKLSELKDTLAKDVSCKGAIKANQNINQAEMQHLYQQLKACEMPYSCPHGRPTIVMVTYYDIEKMFKRVVS